MLKRKLYPELIFSATYICWNLLFEYLRNGTTSPYVVLVVYYFINIALVISITSFTFPRYYRTKMRLWKLGFAIIVSFLIYALLNYLNEGFLSPVLYNAAPNLINFRSYLLPSIPFFVSYSLFGIAIYFFKDSHTKEIALQKERAEALEAKAKQLQSEAANLQLEREKLQLENDYRRAQINPHFLSNTLDMIIGAINTNDPDAGEYVAWLGEIMQYSLKEPAADNKVRLEEEVEAIETLLRLVKARHQPNYHICFEKSGNIEGKRIIAHILLTLVENALKYGYIADEKKPTRIKLEVVQNQLRFYVTNYIWQNKLRNSNGIGLHNLSRRLELVYGNKFTYNNKSDGITYHAELTLML
jgi:two-component system, LytTR family, sensor kinase